MIRPEDWIGRQRHQRPEEKPPKREVAEIRRGELETLR